ncbi:MAG: class I SAM-dependent methyltransferase [Henriciella sp.]|nr:class I SAM-dependent methyltransferase [Henriciella sp.]
MLGASAVILAACSGGNEAPTETVEAETPPVEVVESGPITLADAVAGDWRSDEEKARDGWRNPAETLEFFEVSASDTVVEIWPGGGRYTNVLAPYLASGDGQLIAAVWDVNVFEGERLARIEQRIDDFKAVYEADADLFGTLEYSAFSAQSGPLAAPESVDAVLTFRNVHNWMGGDYSPKFFDDAFAALKPGGVLGVVEHRLPSSAEQDPRGATGYVHEDFVKAMAAASGFEFVAASEINANPADSADHPFGVWTLPPVSRTTDREGNAPEDFDAARYVEIGESDRMTLKFVKPAETASEPVE